MTSWLKAKFGRMRVSTMVLIVAFIALFWVYHNIESRPAAPEAPPTAVVPPGFVPDPNYTWVPRTQVRRPKEAVTPTTTTTTTTTTSPTTTTPTETTSPTSPTETTPTTTVIPGPLGPQTVTLPPTPAQTTPPAPVIGPALTTPVPPG